MEIRFPYERKSSGVFGQVLRPVVEADVWSLRFREWLNYTLIADTGADYTLLPKTFSLDLGIDLKKDCIKIVSQGIGGVGVVYFFEKGLKFKVGSWVKTVPLGFLDRDDVPPLLGRKGCLDELRICFKNFETVISLK